MNEIILPEIVAAGTFNSRLSHKNKSISKKRKTTMFEIELPLENNGVSYIDDDSYRINTKTVICAKPNQIRHTKLPFRCLYIHFQINEGLLFEKLCHMQDFIQISKSELYFELFDKIAKHFEEKSGSDLIMLQSAILELIYLLEKDSKKQNNSYFLKSSNKALIEKIIKYINNNLTEDLSLKTIAEFAMLSPIYLHNIFKESTGKTLHEYVEERRIKKAISLLNDTDCTLTEIAYECGFSSQSYFSYAFKKRMNCTPRKYAQNTRNRYDL